MRVRREYLEKNYSETSGRDTLKLALKALMEVGRQAGRQGLAEGRGQQRAGAAEGRGGRGRQGRQSAVWVS